MVFLNNKEVQNGKSASTQGCRQKDSISDNGSRSYGYCFDFISGIGLSRRPLP
jgi:hypothetical protein